MAAGLLQSSSLPLSPSLFLKVESSCGVVALPRSAEKVVERGCIDHGSCRTGGSPQIETSFSPIARGPSSRACRPSLFLSSFLFLFFLVDSATARKCYKVVLRAEIAHVTGTLLPRICIPAEAPERSVFRGHRLFPSFFLLSRYYTTLRTICPAFFFFPSFQSHCSAFARFYSHGHLSRDWA